MTGKIQKTKDTKEKILEAALALFSKKGFLGAATKDIASEAGVAEVTLFRHFPTKESLLEGVIRAYSFLPELKGLMTEIEGFTYREALREISSRFLKTLRARKELIRIMFSEIPLYPAKAKEIHHSLLDEMTKTLASYFRGLQKNGVLRRFDPEAGARAFMGMFFAFFTSQELCCRERLGNEEAERIFKEFVEIFARGTLE